MSCKDLLRKAVEQFSEAESAEALRRLGGTGVGADSKPLGGLGSEPLDEDEVRVACEGLMSASMKLGAIADGLSVAQPGLVVRAFADEMVLAIESFGYDLKTGLDEFEALTFRMQARSEGLGRNDPCPCGSGRKLKRCHGVVNPGMPA